MPRSKVTIANRLSRLRTMHSLTTAQVAKQLKITRNEYMLIEAGKALPDYFQIERLMKLYGSTSDYLLFGDTMGLKEELFVRLMGSVKSRAPKENSRQAHGA